MAELIKRTDIFPLVRNVIVIDEILQADLRVGDIQPPHDSTPLYSAAQENTSCKESIITNIYKSQW